jgi:hypothetical protein
MVVHLLLDAGHPLVHGSFPLYQLLVESQRIPGIVRSPLCPQAQEQKDNGYRAATDLK